MAGRAKENKKLCKYIRNKGNPNNSLGPLVDGDSKIVNDAEKAEVLKY